MKRDTIILSAYREAVLAAAERGIRGPAATAAALHAASRVAGRLLNDNVSEDEVLRTVRGG